MSEASEWPTNRVSNAIKNWNLPYSISIENIAQRLQVDAQQVYADLTVKSNILYSHIVPGYDILHTQSKDYIVDDILQVMQERGVTMGMNANPILLQEKSTPGR